MGDVGGGETGARGFDAAEEPAFKVEAIAEEEEYLLEISLYGADDVFSEEGQPAAVFAEHAAGDLGVVEEAADFVDKGALAAQVDGALTAVFAPGESVVGAETPAAVGAPSGGDGALGGEAEWIIAEESEGGVVFG